MMQNKKGFLILEILFLITFIFILAVFVFASSLIAEKFSANSGNISINQTYINNARTTINGLDGMILFVFFTLFLGSIISAFFTETHPGFAIIMMLINYILAIVSAIVSNAWQLLTADPAFNTQVHTFTMTMTIMNNLPVITFIMGTFLIIVLVAKRNTGGGQI